MAKAAKKAAPKKGVEKAKKKPAPPRVEAPEFGLQALAKAMNLEEATVRQKLRAAGVEKTGRFYDFKNKTGVEAMAKKLGAKKAA